MNGMKMFLGSIGVAVALVGLLLWQGGGSEESTAVYVYCAAGMRKPVEAVAEKYFDEYGVRVELDFDGSGTLLGKLEAEGAAGHERKRGDLYLAADESYITEARKRGLVRERIPIATMRPVIAMRKGDAGAVSGIADLLRDGVRVAVCNPEQAAVGASTRRALEKTGHWDELEKNVAVMKPTVTDLANDLKVGAIDAAIVWDSTVAMYPELDAVSVEAFEAEKNEVSIAVTSFTRSPPSALRFARYLTARDRGLLEFRKHGFDVIEGDVWEERPELIVWSGGVNRIAIEETVSEFERREGVRVSTTYNGCGVLTAQMEPLAGREDFPDVYFACDRSFMDTVSDWFLPSRLVSETDIVIAVPEGNPRRIEGLADLAGEGMRVGLADRKKSALGALTYELLEELELLEGVTRNVVTTAGTADYLVTQMQVSGGTSLDAVIVYRANAAGASERVDVVPIDHPSAKAEQPIATSRFSGRRRLTDRFIAFLLSPESQKRFAQAGFGWRAESEKGAE